MPTNNVAVVRSGSSKSFTWSLDMYLLKPVLTGLIMIHVWPFLRSWYTDRLFMNRLVGTFPLDWISHHPMGCSTDQCINFPIHLECVDAEIGLIFFHSATWLNIKTEPCMASFRLFVKFLLLSMPLLERFNPQFILLTIFLQKERERKLESRWNSCTLVSYKCSLSWQEIISVINSSKLHFFETV